MPSITVANGASIHYEDSGAVPGVAYTTLILVHGMGFNGGVFKKLHPIAPAHKFRTVAINRRDYAPTSPFTEDERKLLTAGGESHRRHLRNLGLELAQFIDKFATENDLPPATESGEGGVVPLGWSLGGLNIHAFLSALDEVDDDILARLNKWIRALVIHDTSPVGIGLANPPEYDIQLWFNPDLDIRFTNFKDWAVAYYKHKDIHSGKNDTLTYNQPFEFTPDKLAELNLLVHERKPTFHEISAEELKELTSAEVYGGSDTLIIFSSLDLTKDEIRRSLFNRALAAKLPNAKVRYIGGAETAGVMIYALWELQKGLDDPSLWGGEKARDVKIIYTPTGNHFSFWDDPEEALVQYRRAIVE
ncbi:alpha/beta-hydrolase [Pluteus cervinus]|uniref:Alpha/beta-hydrolase n=1 Tax=Pluteus cervinus TaxID=181527 RepID=A0ACD3AS08_9AGAR|nr:alpha/beta-hydrolase [Pluteus cervinus]